MVRIIPEKVSKKKRDQRRIHFNYRGHFNVFHILRVPEKQPKSFYLGTHF